MNTTLKNTLVFIGSLFAGGILNMVIIMTSSKIIPPPEGADLTTMEGLTAAIPLMEPKHFLLPFLAHALGTLLSAWLVTKFAASKQFLFSMIIGLLFFIGGLMNVLQLPSPMWFNLTDLILAYFPMAYLGNKAAQ